MKKTFTLLATLAIALAALAAPDGEWQKIGTGRYYEDLFTFFSNDYRGLNWEVEVEQSATDAAWYRLAPYAVESAVTKAYGGTDNTYLYINTTDPTKVYVEDFTMFGHYEFTQVVPECGWKLGDRYATLTNGIISWPRISVRVTNLDDMSECYDSNTCLNTEFAIVLPGAEVKEKWAEVGKGEFVDGIVSPMMNGTAPLLEVTIMERNDAPGFFKIVAPWAQYGSTEDFLIDATDPDFVTCPFQEGGFSIPEYGVFSLASVGATYVHDGGISKEEFIAAQPAAVITYRDGVIRFPANSVVFNFPMYNLTSWYGAQQGKIGALAMPGFSAIDNVAVDTAADDAPAQYFTLGGVPVENPSAGIYICRKGTAVSKVVIR